MITSKKLPADRTADRTADRPTPANPNRNPTDSPPDSPRPGEYWSQRGNGKEAREVILLVKKLTEIKPGFYKVYFEQVRGKPVRNNLGESALLIAYFVDEFERMELCEEAFRLAKYVLKRNVPADTRLTLFLHLLELNKIDVPSNQLNWCADLVEKRTTVMPELGLPELTAMLPVPQPQQQKHPKPKAEPDSSGKRSEKKRKLEDCPGFDKDYYLASSRYSTFIDDVGKKEVYNFYWHVYFFGKSFNGQFYPEKRAFPTCEDFEKKFYDYGGKTYEGNAGTISMISAGLQQGYIQLKVLNYEKKKWPPVCKNRAVHMWINPKKIVYPDIEGVKFQCPTPPSSADDSSEDSSEDDERK